MNLSGNYSLQNSTDDSESWRQIWKFQVPAAIFGIVGNTLSLLVFSRQVFSHHSSCVYLRFLACVDISLQIVYNTCSTVNVFVQKPNPNSIEEGRFHKVGQYFVVALATLSAWTLVVLSAERVVAVCWPLKVKVLCTKTKAFQICMGMTPLIFLINIHILIMEPLSHAYLPLPGYFTVIYSALPSFILIVCNIILIKKIYHRPSPEQRQSENRSITIMLVVNSIGFVGLTGPFTCFHLLGRYMKDEREAVKLLRIFESLCGFNHCLNFVFYGISGSIFRQELKKMLCSRCLKQEAESSRNSRMRDSDIRRSTKSIERGVNITFETSDLKSKKSNSFSRC